jgi:hypothetical protein
MHRVVVLLGVLAIVLAACGANGPAGAGSASSTQADSEQIVIRTSVVIAATAGADIPATGDVLEGSTLGDAAFCVGGTIEDRHPGTDAAEESFLLVRTFTCPDGTMTAGFSPDVGQAVSPTQGGSWTILSGSGAFERLRGSGHLEATYDADDGSRAQETWSGTVTH